MLLFTKKTYKSEALSKLKDAQMHLLKVESEKLFAESMAVYYTAMIAHYNMVLSDKKDWKGCSPHSDP